VDGSGEGGVKKSGTCPSSTTTKGKKGKEGGFVVNGPVGRHTPHSGITRGDRVKNFTKTEKIQFGERPSGAVGGRHMGRQTTECEEKGLRQASALSSSTSNSEEGNSRGNGFE